MVGYKDWIDAIDIKVDYFSAFMKAWIAFNAWYKSSGEIPAGNDQKCIEFIAGQSNRFKTYIMRLIESEEPEGKTYKETIAKLHEALLNAPIMTQEYIGARRMVSFSEVAVKNNNRREQFESRNIRYECYRANNNTVLVVTNVSTGSELFRFENSEYSMEMLEQQSGFTHLTLYQQGKCKECYEKMIPHFITSVLSSDLGAKKIGVYSFVNDSGKISQAIVTILYMLRCSLAHGDVAPDESSNIVYKYAYEVLVAPIKKLR